MRLRNTVGEIGLPFSFSGLPHPLSGIRRTGISEGKTAPEVFGESRPHFEKRVRVLTYDWVNGGAPDVGIYIPTTSYAARAARVSNCNGSSKPVIQHKASTAKAVHSHTYAETLFRQFSPRSPAVSYLFARHRARLANISERSRK